MSHDGSGTGIDADGLREKNTPQHAHSTESAQATVLDLNSQEEYAEKDEKDKKTFGRTPNGTGECFHTASVFAPVQDTPSLHCTLSGHCIPLPPFHCPEGNLSVPLS